MKGTKYFTSVGSDGSLYLRLTTPTSSRSMKVTSFVKWNFHPHPEAQSRISNWPKITEQCSDHITYIYKFCSCSPALLSKSKSCHGLCPLHPSYNTFVIYWVGYNGSFYTSMELLSFAIGKIFYKIWIQMRLLPSVKFYLKKTLDPTFF